MGAADRPPKLILAPLKGFTDAVFRKAFAAHFTGFDAAVAPFITAAAPGRVTDKLLRDLLPAENAGGLPIVPQILGNDPEGFIDLARRLAELGYAEVNWNLGCPFRPVTKKRRGAGLLPFPAAVDEFLDRVLPALPLRLSIKLRLGRSRADEILHLMPVLNRYPLAELVIHPRTARQMYSGPPDLEAFAACLAASRHPVVYNGDITDPAGFRALSARFPSASGWMIGRGALADPFLPEAIKRGQIASRGSLEAFKAFYDELFGRYGERLCGPRHLLDRMKGFWTYFGKGFQEGGGIEKRVHRIFNLPRYVETVERFFRDEAKRR
jgi:tRNA-dihydrouridine synthase